MARNSLPAETTEPTDCVVSERNRAVRDQFGGRVPEDLVVLDVEPREISSETCAKLDELDWYVPSPEQHPGWGKLILVSHEGLCDALGGFQDGTEPADCGLDRVKAVWHVGRGLHRWSAEDGFYTA